MDWRTLLETIGTRIDAKQVLKMFDIGGASLHNWRHLKERPLPFYVEAKESGRRGCVYFILEELLSWIKTERPSTWKILIKKGFILEHTTTSYKDLSGVAHEL